MVIGSLAGFDEIIEPILHAGRVPGAAIAIVVGGATVFAAGYGYRDLRRKLPMRPDTAYPVASTTKAINATLLGMLVDAGQLEWDAPVQSYLPAFRLKDALASSQITLRDLITMRTGLPRHDWCWLGSTISRATLIEHLRYLDSSCGFRERFQYNNLTVTAAGHIAEIVAGRTWEELAKQMLLEPLAMGNSHLVAPTPDNSTLSYHETSAGELSLTPYLATEVTAPSGGALYSTVEDMALWIACNLAGGRAQGCQLIQPRTLAEIQSPQIVVGSDPSGPTPGASYAMGWFVDAYRGCARISHGGYTNDVNSEVTLFPELDIGIVSTTNFGCPRLARLINEQAFDLLRGMQPTQTVQQKLAEYEHRIEDTRRRRAAARRVIDTSPSHPLDEYAGHYAHPAYGAIEIRCRDRQLVYRGTGQEFVLQHWHYDAWAVVDDETLTIHEPHPLDCINRLLFESSSDGEIAALTVRFEPAVDAIRFDKV